MHDVDDTRQRMQSQEELVVLVLCHVDVAEHAGLLMSKKLLCTYGVQNSPATDLLSICEYRRQIQREVPHYSRKATAGLLPLRSNTPATRPLKGLDKFNAIDTRKPKRFHWHPRTSNAGIKSWPAVLRRTTTPLNTSESAHAIYQSPPPPWPQPPHRGAFA